MMLNLLLMPLFFSPTTNATTATAAAIAITTVTIVAATARMATTPQLKI